MAAKPRKLEVRHSQTFHITLAAIGMIMLVIAGLYGAAVLMGEAAAKERPGWLLLICAAALLYYVVRSVLRFRDRRPQVVVDKDGVRLGFGRNLLVPWDSIQWARVRGLRPSLQLGVDPEHFAQARVSMWNLDDNLTSVPGGGAAIAVRAAGLDTSMKTVLEAMHAWKPSLRPHR
jgi:GNAT superfamily N-acetyltransferase